MGLFRQEGLTVVAWPDRCDDWNVAHPHEYAREVRCYFANLISLIIVDKVVAQRQRSKQRHLVLQPRILKPSRDFSKQVKTKPRPRLSNVERPSKHTRKTSGQPHKEHILALTACSIPWMPLASVSTVSPFCAKVPRQSLISAKSRLRELQCCLHLTRRLRGWRNIPPMSLWLEYIRSMYSLGLVLMSILISMLQIWLCHLTDAQFRQSCIVGTTSMSRTSYVDRDSSKKIIETYQTLRQESDERESQSIGREPSILLDDNIHLVDALGRSHSLPYQCFQYWPVCEVYQSRFSAENL